MLTIQLTGKSGSLQIGVLMAVLLGAALLRESHVDGEPEKDKRVTELEGQGDGQGAFVWRRFEVALERTLRHMPSASGREGQAYRVFHF